jgi:hypothetical protein
MIKPDVAAPIEQVRAQIAETVKERFSIPSSEVAE